MKKYTLSAILLSVLVVLASSAPILYFYLHPQDNLVFLGRRYVNSQDVYTYVSFIEQAKQGRTLFENLYTTEAQSPSLLRPSYLGIGKLAQLTSMPAIGGYHLARIFLSFLFCLILYRFLRHFFKDENGRFLAYALILTASGLGWLVARWSNTATDLWIPEGNTFMMLGEAPHFILSQILMLAGFDSFLSYLKDRKLWRIILAAVLFLALSFEHPFNLVIIAPTLFLTALWSQIPLLTALSIAVSSALGLGYQYYTTLANPILASWQAQNILLSPTPSAYLLGYGIILILGLIAAEKWLQTKVSSSSSKFLLTWVGVTLLLLYIPLSFQRRLVEGLHVALGILATSGLLLWTGRYRERLAGQLIALTIGVLSLTSIYNLYTDFKAIGKDQAGNHYYHLSGDEQAAIAWLGRETSSDDVILSNWFNGNLIPGLIGRKVYLGHQIQTTDWDGKNRSLDVFVHNTDPSLSQKFLKDHGVTYVFLSKNDILTQNGLKPENYRELKSVYSQNEVTIYKVNLN